MFEQPLFERMTRSGALPPTAVAPTAPSIMMTPAASTHMAVTVATTYQNDIVRRASRSESNGWWHGGRHGYARQKYAGSQQRSAKKRLHGGSSLFVALRLSNIAQLTRFHFR